MKCSGADERQKEEDEGNVSCMNTHFIAVVIYLLRCRELAE
jgi:hypothetical protein